MSDEEIYRVLDPDPRRRESVNEASRSEKVNLKSVNEVPKGNVDFVDVVRKGVVEKRKLNKNPVKARLIQATKAELKRISKATTDKSESESEAESEVRSVVEEPSECATAESYASRAARTAGPATLTHRNMNVNNSNHLPGRPCTAFFTPSQNRSASSVFEALDRAEIGERDILCLHSRQGGEVQITFRTRALTEKFLSLNSIKINGGHFALQVWINL